MTEQRGWVTWLLGLLAGAAALWCALAAWIIVASTTAPGPGEPGYGSTDPHGFALVGAVLMLVVGLPVLLAFGLPWLARVRRGRRHR